MTDSRLDPNAALPSPRTLLHSTIVAATVAGVLLATVVLPAEYGIDPTGAGRLLGLTPMGEIKVSLAKDAAMGASVEEVQAPPIEEAMAVAPVTDARPAEASVEESSTEPILKKHVTEIVLAPNEGKEIKLVMRKHARVTFSWSTDRGVVNYDTHADAPGIKYHGYQKGLGEQSESGELVAAFDGSHGWFWRNRGKESVTVTLRTSGEYQELKRM